MPFSVLFCGKCESHRIDVCAWPDGKTAMLVCHDCHNAVELAGATVGRVWTTPEADLAVVEEARKDLARPDCWTPRQRWEASKRRTDGA